MSPISRDCTKCGQHKDFSEFSKAPRGKFGIKASCKACDAAQHLAGHPPKDRISRPRRAEHDPDSLKLCGACGETKPRRLFSLSRAASGGRNAVYQSRCKTCQATAARKWFTDNKDRANENRRRFNLKANYGLTIDDYNSLLLKQNHVCAICGRGEPNAHGRTGKRFRLSVDHCHESGTIRGLLCQKCNRAIGLLGDDVVLIRKALSYLLRHQPKVAV